MGDENNISHLKKKTSTHNNEDDHTKPNNQKEAPKHIELSQNLSDLVLIPTIKPKATDEDPSGLEYHALNGKCYQITSFVETKVFTLTSSEETGNKLTRFNSSVMSRTYPKGMRVDSSNYNPVPLWYGGCQIVALNYQTPDIFLRINEGKFQKNKRNGYILKPQCLRVTEDNPVIDWPGAFVSETHRRTTKVLYLKIISGWRLVPKTEWNSNTVFVKVSLYTANDIVEKFTEIVDDNLHNPFFNSEFAFDIIHEEIDMIMMEVFDKKKNLLFYYSIPVDCMRNGFRVVPLKDLYGREEKEAELFVHSLLNKI